MLKLKVYTVERFDETNQRFIAPVLLQEVKMEHSLLSISKWEQKFEKPFLPTTEDESISGEELSYYIECMTIGTPKEGVIDMILHSHMEVVTNYIKSDNSATVITTWGKKRKPARRKVVTSEQIYSWMCRFNIPFDAEKWHLNRLLMLIQIRSIQENPKKLSKKESMDEMHALNRERQASLNRSK